MHKFSFSPSSLWLVAWLGCHVWLARADAGPAAAAGQARSPAQLVLEFESRCKNASAARAATIDIPGAFKKYPPEAFECEREPAAWRWLYTDELGASGGAGARVLVNERSLDERLANLLYTANSASALDREMFTFNWDNREREEANLAQVAGRVVDDGRCGRDLARMLAQMGELSALLARARQSDPRALGSPKVARLNSSHIQLARVLDSFGRYESGHWSGRSLSLGSHYQCTSSRLDFAPTRYCIANLKADTHLADSLLDNIKRPLVHIPKISLSMGVCLPESCHSSSLLKHPQLFQQLADKQLQLPEHLYVHNKLPLESLFCLVDQDSAYNQLSLAGQLFLVSAGLWLLLVAFASLRPGRASDLVSCFDVRRAWADFTNTRPTSQARRMVDLDALNVIKLLLCSYVIYGHCFTMIIGVNTNQLQMWRQLERGHLLDLSLFGTIAVDLFLVISGLISGYLMMRKLSASKHRMHLRGMQNLARFAAISSQMVLLRSLRLLPMYYLIFWWKKSLFIHMGSGPMWDKGLNNKTPVGSCSTASWLEPLTFGYTTDALFRKCVGQGWYISAEIFASLFYVPLILLYSTRPRLSLLLSALVLLISLLVTELQVASQAPPALLWELNSIKVHGIFQMMQRLSAMSIQPHCHVPFAIFGVFAGYALHHYERRASLDEPEASQVKIKSIEAAQVQRAHWPSWFKIATSHLAAPLPFALLALSLYLRDIERWLTWPLLILPDYLHLVATVRTLVCASSALVFVRMLTDWNENKLIRFFCAPFWQMAVKLSFIVYIIHIELLFFDAGLNEQQYEFSKWRIAYLYGYVYSFALIIALPLHLLIEIPIKLLVQRSL